MKTYINFRVGLFIGLLSFSTLSSCVNTRRELGMGNWNREYRNVINGTKRCCGSPTECCCSPTGKRWLVGTGLALAGTALLVWLARYYSSNQVGMYGGVLPPCPSLMPFGLNQTALNDQLGFVLNSIKAGEEKYGNNGTDAVVGDLLNQAVCKNQTEHLQSMIDHGANVNVPGKDGFSPLLVNNDDRDEKWCR